MQTGICTRQHFDESQQKPAWHGVVNDLLSRLASKQT